MRSVEVINLKHQQNAPQPTHRLTTNNEIIITAKHREAENSRFLKLHSLKTTRVHTVHQLHRIIKSVN